MTGLPLPRKIVAIDAALAEVPHAFGGAIALGYWAEPRATIDIDLNVFVPAERSAAVLEPLGGLGVDVAGAAEVIGRDGQARVLWDVTPIDLFFAYDPFHDAADEHAVEVPFAEYTIRVLSADHLTICKAVFDRPKDWIDIDAMITHRTAISAAEVLRWVGRIVGDEDPRYGRIAAVLSATG
ncbi:hypothetical protein BH23ACT2_BH23ACT2_22400 [soil metagenome]